MLQGQAGCPSSSEGSGAGEEAECSQKCRQCREEVSYGECQLRMKEGGPNKQNIEKEADPGSYGVRVQRME